MLCPQVFMNRQKSLRSGASDGGLVKFGDHCCWPGPRLLCRNISYKTAPVTGLIRMA